MYIIMYNYIIIMYIYILNYNIYIYKFRKFVFVQNTSGKMTRASKPTWGECSACATCKRWDCKFFPVFFFCIRKRIMLL